MSVLKIALLQLVSYGADQKKNRIKGEEYCRRAKERGADIALFPEMWNIGYTAYSPRVWEDDFNPLALDAEERRLRDTWQSQAIASDEEFVLHFRHLAEELEMAIAITYLEKWPGAPRNTVSLIDRHGEIVLTYAKVHTCDFSLEAACTPGDDFHVCALSTTQGDVKIGAMICYDCEFPESARILMLKGAEIILTPNSCDLEQNRLLQFRARAYENMVGVVRANYAAPQCNGHSVAFDPIAFGPNGSRDTLVIEAGEREGIYLAEFDLEELRNYRKRETWGNSYRKPRAYALLVSPAVEEPFVRTDSRR